MSCLRVDGAGEEIELERDRPAECAVHPGTGGGPHVLCYVGEPDQSTPRVIISGVRPPAIEIRDHLVGPCAQLIGDDQVVVDVGAVVRRLVLFERYTLRTARMLDIPALVGAFGESGLRALLADGCLRIHCDGLTMGSVGQGLPPGTFQFAVLRAHDQRRYVGSCLQEVHTIAGLSDKQAKKLKRAIAEALTDATGGGEQANRQLDYDLDTAAPVLRDGIALAARTELGAELDPATVRLDVERLDELTVRTRSNLDALLGVDADAAHDLVQRGLLAVGGLNTRLELMERLSAISGCAPGELSVIDGKLRSLWAETDPDGQEQRLLRVLQLAELPEPDLTASPAVDVDKLLEARDLPETKALRAWLRTADQLDDAAIRESFHKVQEALARAVHSTTGKVARFAITTAAGLLPGGGIVGTGLGALDGFLVDKVISEPGPYSFLSDTWPSLFTGS
jgi:hypothetical protein